MQKKKEIRVIPADPKYDRSVRVEQKILNVAAYCRVSTRYEQQENSFEAQVNYFTEKNAANPLWNYAGIYSDQGKTATSTKTRDSFNDMLEDCYSGKIDLILTKSISRFARNTVDFLRIIRELKEHHVRIIFEKENIDTMDSSGELLITILSSQAQEESRNLSENTRWGIVRKFEQGIIQINHTKFLGYTKDSEGRLVIVPEEAEIVIKIYDLYLQGFGFYKIAKILEQEEIKTVTGNTKWHPVWRCGERMKTGTKKCKSSPSLKEDKLYSLILNQIQMIMEAQIDTSSSPLLQTKALIASYIGDSKIEDFEMTKLMWDSIIETVIIKGKDKAVIHFKTSMTQEMTLC